MKTQFLLLLLTLTTFSVYSQKQFEGSCKLNCSLFVNSLVGAVVQLRGLGLSNQKVHFLSCFSGS